MPKMGKNSPVVNSRQREMARLDSMGVRRKEIAEALGVAKCFVTTTLQKPHVAAHLASLHARRDRRCLEVREELDKNALPAAKVAVGIMKDAEQKGGIRLKAAEAVLDRTGHSRQKESRRVETRINVNVLELLRERQKGVKAMEADFAEFSVEQNEEGETSK